MKYSVGGKTPKIHGKVGFIAPGVQIVGDVTLEGGVNIWFNAVLRADVDQIFIGEDTNIQDGAVIHVDHGFACTLGRGVTVAHGVVLHGCRIEDNCLIGMNAVVLNGAVIGENSLVGAGAMVPQGMVVPPGSLVLGSPARVVKDLKPGQIEGIRKNAGTYKDLSREFKKTCLPSDGKG